MDCKFVFDKVSDQYSDDSMDDSKEYDAYVAFVQEYC